MESCACRNYMILSSSNSSLRSIRVLDVWWNQIESKVQILSHLLQWDTMLVVHSERVYLDIVVSEKLNSLLEGWSRVGRFQRAEGDNVNISPPAANLEIPCP